MSQVIEIKVPDIGDYDGVPVIEVHVKPGDVVEKEQSLVTLESDKATMDVPSSHAGVVKEVKVKVGDSISEGHVVILLEESGSASTQAAPAATAPVDSQKAAAPAAAPAPASASGGLVNVNVPDIGDYKGVPVIEVHVKPGDVVEKEQSLVTLESDKATMDVPSSHSGVVKEVKVKVGDSISEGDLVVILESSSAGASPTAAPSKASAASAAPVAPVATASSSPAPTKSAPQASAPRAESVPTTGAISHASPSVRKYARELGVDVSKVIGTSAKGRISQEDVQAYVKNIMTGQAASPAGAPVAASGGLNLLPWPKIDFSKFGETETKPLSRIQKLSAANLSRNWVMIPAVTYHEDADITDLEAFRVMTNKDNEKQGIKVTMLAFLIKAAVNALKKYPEFNSSLDGDNLVMKKYFHIAFAADTPNGLVVPVVKNADKKGIFEIAKETGELAKLAREGKLKPDQMQGASFTISSLGGIGGTYFAPIINAPEVAILGVNKASMKPVWDGKQFVPKLICPLSLTADHRVIDGALATRFNVYLAELLADFRRVVL
jgi:pyruvate dehydrogenase E2 component (dihydrolipoamide acetyltransferase)